MIVNPRCFNCVHKNFLHRDAIVQLDNRFGGQWHACVPCALNALCEYPMVRVLNTIRREG